MATYIKGLTDTVPEIKPFQPNLNLAQQALSTLQSRYDQGFASVKNVYNQILNAPITSLENQTVRDGFLKEAELKLKNLASVDLSLPENQEAAEQVFSPFWEDNMIVQDQGLTKALQSEIEKANMYRTSKDDKMRAQYSDTAMRYLTNELGKLQGAGRDPARFAQIEKRRFVPFQDMQLYLDQRAKDMGLEISWQSENGPELKTHTGGKYSLESFESFAHNALGDQFTDQFRVMSKVQQEEMVRQVKMLNPSMTDQEAMTYISKEVIKEKKEGLASRQSSLSADLERVRKQIEPYKSQPGLTKEQGIAYRNLLMMETKLDNQVKQANGELDKFASLEQTPEKYLGNLDGYFSDVIKQRTVKRWANARAIKQSEKIELSPIWDAKYKMSKDARDHEWEKWKYMHPQKKSKGSSSSSGGGDDDDVDIADPEQAGRYEAVDTTHADDLGSAEKVFETDQRERWSYAHESLFSSDVGGRILKKKNIDTGRAVEYLGVMRKLASDPDGEQLTEKDRALLYNFSQELHGKHGAGDLMKIDEATGAKSVKGFGAKNFYQVRSEFLQAMKENLQETFKDDAPGYEDADFKMLMGYMTAKQSLEEHEALEVNKAQAIEKHIVGDKKYEPFVVERNGRKSLITVEDMEKQFKPVVVTQMGFWGEGEKKTLTARQLAEMYMNGDLEYGHDVVVGGVGFKIKGDRYRIDEYGGMSRKSEAERLPGWGAFKRQDPNNEFMKAYDAIDKRFESSKNFKKKLDSLYEKVVPDLPQYQGKTGAQGFVVRYDFNKKTQGEAAVRIANEAAEAGNNDGIYVNGEFLQSGDPRRAAIVEAMQLRDDQIEDVISTVKLRTRGVKGRPSLQLVFKPSTKKEENLTPIEQLAGQTIEVDLNPNASGETLRRIRYNSGNYVYGRLMRGKEVKSDPILEAAHISFRIIPNDPSRPSGAIVEMHAKDFQNGKYVDIGEVRDEFSWTQFTPDEVVAKAHELAYKQYLKNLQARKTFYQRNGGIAGTLVSPKDIENEVRGSMGG